MYAGKPIIGLSGGIGAGKTFVGKLFADLGCLVISSDSLVRLSYLDLQFKQILRQWWGDTVFDANGEVDRAAVGGKIFARRDDRLRLEEVLHPRVAQLRQSAMEAAAADKSVSAYVWDSPLLFETRLSESCDATVFVDAPQSLRIERVMATRGWDAEELTRREKSQMPLDKKRALSDYVISNVSNAASTGIQVQDLLTRILAGESCRPLKGHGR